MESHVILRVPPELSERVQALVKPRDAKPEDVEISTEKGDDTGRLFRFKLGDEEYYATLRDLPTVVETMKSKKKQHEFYKSANVGQVLEVSNVKVGTKPRPVVNTMLDDGLTPPMSRARSERFRRMDRAVKHNLPPDTGKQGERQKLVQRMDAELNEIVDKLSQKKNEFVHEEIVDMEPYMHYWDTKTVIKQGTDNFITETRKAYDLAYENFLKKTGSSHHSKPQPERPSLIVLDSNDLPGSKNAPKPLGQKKAAENRASRPAPAPPSATVRAAPPPPPVGLTPATGAKAPRPWAPSAAAAPPAPSPPAPSPPAPSPSTASSAPAPSPPAVSVGGGPSPSPSSSQDAQTDGGQVTPSALTPAATTPGVATPGVTTPSGPQPSPQPSPGADGADEETRALIKKRDEAQEAFNRIKQSFDSTTSKWRTQKIPALKKRFEVKRNELKKELEAAIKELEAAKAQLAAHRSA